MPDDDSSSEGEVEFTGENEEEEEDTPMGNANDDGDDDDDDDDDEPLIKMGKRASRGAPVSYAENNDDDNDDDDNDDDDSDDDDIPLSSLVQNKKKPAPPAKKTTNGSKQMKAKATSPPKKKAKTSTTKKAPPKKSSSTVSATSSSSKNYEWASAALYGTESTKGLLIQRLLCRWWYAITWPDPTKLPAKPPKYYDSLDGFPGVYVCTSAAGDEAVGHILDLRKGDADRNKPCFENFAKKPALELQELLLQALENQRAKLHEMEGPGTATEKELQELIKWTKKVNPSKADKEAIKVLKAYKLEL